MPSYEVAADAAMGGDQFIIDVQTHYVADRLASKFWAPVFLANARFVAADRFRGPDKLMHSQVKVGYSFA